MLSEELLIKVIENIALDLDYDMWKEIFNYYEEDHKGTDDYYEKKRLYLIASSKKVLSEGGVDVE